MNITQLQKTNRNQYGDLDISIKEALWTAYPKLKIVEHSPGCHGGNADLFLKSSDTLSIPNGKYMSSKHYHTNQSAVVTIETAKNNRLNLARRPLFLLKGVAYNGDYRSLTTSYFLFGQNEDNSYFCHKIKPSVGETGNLYECRRWIWNLKENETIKARQGDLGFISKKPAGKLSNQTTVRLGNHTILAEAVKQTKYRVYALNPKAVHKEHDSVNLDGWYELRLGRAWQQSSAD